MAKGTLGMMKAIGTGLIAGMAVGAAGAAMMMDSKKTKKRAVKAIDAFEGLLDGMQDLLR